jgi:HD-like signal output (HDOD) protein/ActR/RegA family two-component response regulator
MSDSTNPTSEHPEARRSRLLFVDDESLVLQGLQRTLRSMREQWDMTFVESGELALQALAREPFDAIISDMRMPRMDGAQLLEKVKELYPEVVRMVLSGQASQDEVLRSIGPAHQYLSKPCDPKELKLRLTQAFVMRDLLQNSAVRALVSGLKSIPSLPGLYYEILAELRSDDTSLDKIAGIVAKDVGMTAKILQLANSAFMGVRYEITNPTQAVALIGTEMVRALVLSVHVFSQFEDSHGAASHWTTLWEHSVAVACLAQRIAASEKSAKALVDESFTAGLLHEVGKLVLLARMPKEYDLLLQGIAENPATLAAAERERFGCTHADLGAYLMSIWGLPLPLIQAVAFHDRPAESAEERFTSLTVVHAADAIISSTHSSLIVQDVQLDKKYLQHLGLSEREPVWRGLYDQQVEQARVRATKDPYDRPNTLCRR